MTYNAVVARLGNVREHPNADRLRLATVLGSQVVVGIDANEGELGIYFPTDGKLSLEYCTKNDLYPRYEIDDAGKKTKVGGGMFDPKNSRVRAQNLRSVKSDGYFASLDSVAYTGVNLTDLYEGYQFHTLNDHLICEKYYTPQTLRAMKGGTKPLRKKNVMMPEHLETAQFAYSLGGIPPGSICYLTLKQHGMSHRLAHVAEDVERPTRWYHKLLRLTPKSHTEWKVIHGTRRVVLGDQNDTDGGYYGDHAFRFRATESLEGNLRKGEVVYGEIVGYHSETGLIMGSVSTKNLRKDEGFKSMFDGAPPAEMKYTYNCLPGECEFYVYRICHADESGHLIELSWPQVKARCSELGVKHVPELIQQPLLISSGADIEHLEGLVESLNDGLDPIDPSHVREGVVVRVEQPDGSMIPLKSKGWTFKVLESIIKLDDSYVDAEEIA